MAEYYHIMLKIPGVDPGDEQIKKKMNLAIDWYRYAPNCWIVYTTSDAAKWYSRLGELVKEKNGSLFICRLDLSDRQGWIGKGLWEWLKQPRG